MALLRNEWRERTCDETVAQALTASGCSPLFARVLASRGVTAETLEDFFDLTPRRLLPPRTLPGIDAAVAVIAPFVRQGRKIVVFGDYDTDGVSATAILVTVLRKLGACVGAFIPERVGEGYGMTDAAIARLFREHPDVALVITVDNGITAAREIAAVRAHGVAVVVTDHHLPPADEAGAPETIPEAEALVNPKVASAPGFDDLCGSGVAFFLAQALVETLRDEAVAKGALRADEHLSGPLLVLAGLATMADLVPLHGQNRLIVAEAVKRFATCAPVGLRELNEHATRRTGVVVARDFSFQLAPRINAAGRMDSAQLAFDLLITQDREEARRLTVTLDQKNAERKTVEKAMFEDAWRQLPKDGSTDALVVAEERRPAGSAPWNSGVAGIVASRLLENLHIPVAVVVGDHGSARAPEGYNVRSALDAAAETLSRHGGHAAAGGFTVKPGCVDAFERLFAEACARQRQEARQHIAAYTFDGWVRPADLTMQLVDELQRLEPLGEGNPDPVFGLKGIFFSDAKPMGLDGRHASFSLAGRGVPRAVWWNHGPDAEIIRAHSATRYDILFTVTSSDFGTDIPHVELRVVDIRPVV